MVQPAPDASPFRADRLSDVEWSGDADPGRRLPASFVELPSWPAAQLPTVFPTKTISVRSQVEVKRLPLRRGSFFAAPRLLAGRIVLLD
jgi:hypothetical protein